MDIWPVSTVLPYYFGMASPTSSCRNCLVLKPFPRLDICQKIYTTEFSGRKIYTLKVRKFRLFSGKIYTVDKNFTRPPVVTVATNLNSATCLTIIFNITKTIQLSIKIIYDKDNNIQSHYSSHHQTHKKINPH